MARYRVLQVSFWEDVKILDEFTPEDKYFYLWLMTNPFTNLAGCYEFSMKQAERETGYTRDTIEALVDRLENYLKVIRFNKSTKEILLINFHKYNWTKSEKYRKALYQQIENVKCEKFKKYLQGIYSGNEEEPEPEPVEVKEKKKPVKHKYGTYKHVLLTDEEYKKLDEKFNGNILQKVQDLDNYLENHKIKHYDNHYLTICQWYAKEKKQQEEKQKEKGSVYQRSRATYDLEKYANSSMFDE